MNGLELSRLYYEEYGRQLIQQHFPEYEQHIRQGWWVWVRSALDLMILSRRIMIGGRVFAYG